MNVLNHRALACLLVLLTAVIFSHAALADQIIVKAYQSAFPGSHPKCSQCHTRVIFGVKWNAYGQAVKKAINGDGVGNKPTAADIGKIKEHLKRIGKI